jgi:SAM-dependent methyltransferase
VTDDAFAPGTVRAAYDAAAAEYAVAFAEDLSQLEVDRAVLDETADRVAAAGSLGPVIDLGCGPAQVGAHLARRGASVVGVDLSPGMLAVARAREASMPLACGDMRALPLLTASCAAVVAFYCLQHIDRAAVPLVLEEIRRVLSADGMLVVAVHLGDGEVFVTDFLGHEVSPMGGTLFAADELTVLLGTHGFALESTRTRLGLAHEYQSERVYVIARAVPHVT